MEFLSCPFPDCKEFGGEHVLVHQPTNTWKSLCCGREGTDINEIQRLVGQPKTSLSFYKQLAIEEIRNPERVKGCPTGWASFDKVLGGFRKGEFTIVTGGTGNGKSTFGFSLMQKLSEMDKDWKFLAMAGEDRPQRILRKLASAYAEQEADENTIEEFCNQFEDRFHIVNYFQQWEQEESQSSLDTLKQRVTEYLKWGFNFILIDHAHLFISEGENEIEDIRKLCQYLRKLVMTHPIHVLLVVQPTKLQQDQKKVKMRNLRGSVIWEQSAWNVISVYRKNEEDHIVEVEIEKNREFGTIGNVLLEFNITSQANYKELKE